jgi:hypothetical protein
VVRVSVDGRFLSGLGLVALLSPWIL